MSTFDKADVIEQAARALSPAVYGMEFDRLPGLLHPAIGSYAAAALPVIVDAALAPIEAILGDIGKDPQWRVIQAQAAIGAIVKAVQA